MNHNDSRIIKVIQSSPVWLPQTQTWMYNQTKYLPEDIEPHIVCEKTENLDQFYLPNIHSLSDAPFYRYYWDKGLRKLRIRRYCGFLVQMAKKHKAQVVHSHFGNIGWADIGAVKRINAKHVVTFYGLDVNMLPTQDPRWYKRYEKLFKSADIFLCEGPHMAQCLINMGCPQNKVKVQHLGVKVDKISFKPRKWQQGETLRVLIAASFREKKGIPYALEALGRLQKEVDLEITIIGDASPEDRSLKEKELILNVIEKYQMGHIVRKLGYQPYKVLFEEAYKHHIFLSPSVTAQDGDTEGGAPVTIIEMAASGMPIISTTHCDIPEVIENGATGLLAPERDVDGLISHIRWLLENSNLWEAMLRTGQKKIKKEFDVRMQAKRLGTLYSNLLKQ